MTRGVGMNWAKDEGGKKLSETRRKSELPTTYSVMTHEAVTVEKGWVKDSDGHPIGNLPMMHDRVS